MAYKKKRTFFYAGSQRLPSTGGDGDSGNANGSTGGSTGGNGRYNRFNRFNKNNGNGEEDESQITTGPAITIQVCHKPLLKLLFRSFIS